MQKFFQLVGFLAGVFVFGVGIYALFKGVGSSSGGSFKMDDVIEFKGDSTAIVFVLVGVFLMVAAAGWFRSKKNADVERSKKLAVGQDLKKYIQATEPLTKFTGPQEITPVNQELRRALTDYAPALSAESQAVLRELEKSSERR